MNEISNPEREDITLMTSSQVGKSEVVLNAIGYFVDQDPCPVLVVQPTINFAKDWSKKRLATMTRASPCLKGKVKDARSRDSENTLLAKNFPGGNITIAGANAPQGLSGWPIRAVLLDEVDRFPSSAGTEGDPVKLAFRRTETFQNRKRIRVSTPTNEGFSRIAHDYAQSDQRHFYLPCPHCGDYQMLVFGEQSRLFDHKHGTTGKMIWNQDERDSTRYVCKNGCEILERYKHAMLAEGEWRAHNPGARMAGFHLSALYSPWARWADLRDEFLDSRKNPDLLKVFVNTGLGETWEQKGEKFDPDDLKNRRESYGAEVPDGVGVLTASVDVQADRLELKVKGWGAGEESWLITHERIFGDPETSKEPWSRLLARLSRPWTLENGNALRIRCTAIDTGFLAQTVYDFVRGKEGMGIFAVKGVSRPGQPIPLVGNPSKPNRKRRVKLFPIGVDAAKDRIFARLKIQEPGPLYMHFCQPNNTGADDEYLAQFGSEKRFPKTVDGQLVHEYRQVRTRNEALDLEVYALAALNILGPSVVDDLERWVRKAQQSKKRKKSTKQRPGKGWVGGWRNR